MIFLKLITHWVRQYRFRLSHIHGIPIVSVPASLCVDRFRKAFTIRDIVWMVSNSCPPWWVGRWPPPWSWGSGGWGRQRSRTWWDSEPKYKIRFKTSYNHQHIRLHFGIWKQTIESKSVLYWGLGIHEPQTIAKIGLALVLHTLRGVTPCLNVQMLRIDEDNILVLLVWKKKGLSYYMSVCFFASVPPLPLVEMKNLMWKGPSLRLCTYGCCYTWTLICRVLQ